VSCAREIGVLQCVAVRCSVLQCVAVCCSVLLCVAVCCRVLQCVAASCAREICVLLLHVNLGHAQPIALGVPFFQKENDKSQMLRDLSFSF